ncbi:phospholipase D Active site motif protein [Paracoccidioides lutzii Pb01]|uniref:Phospholipase D Active site motif protein n=1 Tax=Paracoccidioides lutzii (strain ATCC MYA-826 / Pb01) TaxID=502779 RepID=C1GNX5_PARBA|nr:phospholipase D Active site motif protein [Paracoccidioides lutzii Pb01]EEH35897.2 phospholipase D Active site motif protein [Paracoccidioides lutzii Pb01]
MASPSLGNSPQGCDMPFLSPSAIAFSSAPSIIPIPPNSANMTSRLFSFCSPIPSPSGRSLSQIVPLKLVAAGFAACLCFSAVLIFLARPVSRNLALSDMFPEWIYELCRDGSTVTSELANDPDSAPRDIIDRLFRPQNSLCDRCDGGHQGKRNKHLDLQQAYLCGKWGDQRPSDIFLQIYHDVVCTLDRNPMAGLTSPALLGSSGVVPLTIIAPTPDICRHMANCIVRAEKEVFLATNYWIFSRCSTIITDALREISVRAGKRGTKVVVKIMYDRAQLKQIFKSRLFVYPKVATDVHVQLPPPEHIPNLDLEVMNYHDPVLGTFHSKFMIVDRRLALLQSNNIQDNDNLEMLVRLEGPIVDSLYDMAIISWNTKMRPMLPMINSPAASDKPPSFADHISRTGPERITGAMSTESSQAGMLERNDNLSRDCEEYLPDIVAEAAGIQARLRRRGFENKVEAIARPLNIIKRPNVLGDTPEWPDEDDMIPYILHSPHKPFPMALVCREPCPALNRSSVYTPQNVAFLSAIRNARRTIFIQTPNLNAEYLLDPILEAVRRGVEVTCYLSLGYNDAGQLLPFQNGTNEMISNRLYNSLSSEEEKSRLRIYNYVAKDQTRPINNKFKQRSCHIKLMIVDEHIAIQGSGNLDTQSFYHSQEANVLLDSTEVCQTWLEGLRRNQNTATYGAVNPQDGCWHDPVTGEMAEGSIGVDPGRFSWMKGIVGVIKRVQGAGGF